MELLFLDRDSQGCGSGGSAFGGGFEGHGMIALLRVVRSGDGGLGFTVLDFADGDLQTLGRLALNCDLGVLGTLGGDLEGGVSLCALLQLERSLSRRDADFFRYGYRFRIPLLLHRDGNGGSGILGILRLGGDGDLYIPVLGVLGDFELEGAFGFVAGNLVSASLDTIAIRLDFEGDFGFRVGFARQLELDFTLFLGLAGPRRRVCSNGNLVLFARRGPFLLLLLLGLFLFVFLVSLLVTSSRAERQ